MKSLVLFVIFCVSVSLITNLHLKRNQFNPNNINNNEKQKQYLKNSFSSTDPEEDQYDSQINNFLSEINNSNKFIIPNSASILNFDPDLLMRISFHQNGEVPGTFKYSNEHLEFKPHNPDSFLIAKLNDNKISKFEFYKAVLSMNPRHYSNDFKNEVELSLVFKYNQRFFDFDNGKIRKKKYLIISLPYAVKRLMPVSQEEPKNKTNIIETIEDPSNNILNSYYENYYVKPRKSFNYERVLKRHGKNKLEDQKSNFNLTDNKNFSSNVTANSTLLNENDNSYLNATYTDDPIPHDSLKFYNDQLDQLSAKRFYRSFNIFDNLLKDFLFDFDFNRTIKQENKNNNASSPITKNNTSKSTNSSLNSEKPQEISISITIKRKNYDFINNNISNIEKINSLKNKRYTLVSANDNENNFYFNEVNENEIIKKTELEIVKNGTMQFKSILESFKKEIIYFEEPSLDDYSFVLNSKSFDLSENSSWIKIGISNFVFIENNFISEEFYNVLNQTLIQLKLQQEKVNNLQANIEDLENKKDFANQKFSGIKRFISFVDEKMLYEINDFINDFKFVKNEVNDFLFENAEKKINWINMEPSYIKKNFIKHFQIKENINYSDNGNENYKNYKENKNAETNYSLKCFEDYIQKMYPDYYSRFLALKIFIKNYIIGDIVKKPELADLKEIVEIEEKFAKIFEIFFKLTYKKDKKDEKNKNPNNNNSNSEAELKDINIYKNLLSGKNSISSNYISKKTQQLLNKHTETKVEVNNSKTDVLNERLVIPKVYDENYNLIPLDLINSNNKNIKKSDNSDDKFGNFNAKNYYESNKSLKLNNDKINEEVKDKNSISNKEKGKTKKQILEYKRDDRNESNNPITITNNSQIRNNAKSDFKDFQKDNSNGTAITDRRNNTGINRPFMKHQKIKYINGTFIIIDTLMLPSDKSNMRLAKKKFQEMIDME